MIDALIQLAGRLHPAVLHLPIGLLVGLVTVELIQALRRRPVPSQLRGPLVWLTALSAAAAVGSGLMLAREGDPAATVLRLHKWLGFAIASSCLLAALVQPRGGGGMVYRFLIIVGFGAMLAGGHLGATMTHGADFLLEPFRSFQLVSVDSTADGVPEVVTARCTGCHDDERRKGGLSLASLDAAMQGGHGGVVIVPGDAEASELIRRITLPVDDDDHMPPASKPQLTAEEIALLTAWIDHPNLVMPAEDAAPVVAVDMPPAASQKALAALTDALVHVERLGSGSTLLFVDTAAVAEQIDDTRARALLAPLREQTAEVVLARTRVTDDVVSLLAEIPNLRRADLTGTAVTDAGLAGLRGHERLEELILVRTEVTDASIEVLARLPALTHVYAWGSKLTPEGLATLRAQRPALVVDDGGAGETEVLELEPELVFTKPEVPATALDPVNEACPVTGAPVNRAFAVVHKGRVIGFCCENCPSAFWKDPEAFAAKLP